MTIVNLDATNIGMDVKSAMSAFQVSGGILAGSAILVGHALCINSSGELALTDIGSERGDSMSKFVGLSPKGYADEDVASAYGNGARFNNYSTGMTPGEYLYVSGSTPGLLDTSSGSFAVTSASSTTLDAPVALCISSTDIIICR